MTNRDILDELRVRGELAERLKRMAPRYREIITLRKRLRQLEKKAFKELSEGLTDSPWHTGTPSEEGWYLVAFNYEDEEGVRYTTDYFKDGKWAFPMVRDISKVIAWIPIEPYKEG